MKDAALVGGGELVVDKAAGVVAAAAVAVAEGLAVGLKGESMEEAWEEGVPKDPSRATGLEGEPPSVAGESLEAPNVAGESLEAEEEEEEAEEAKDNAVGMSLS